MSISSLPPDFIKVYVNGTDDKRILLRCNNCGLQNITGKQVRQGHLSAFLERNGLRNDLIKSVDKYDLSSYIKNGRFIRSERTGG
jgi:hypothetical protein